MSCCWPCTAIIVLSPCNITQRHRHHDSLPEWSQGVDSSSTSASCVGPNPTAVKLWSATFPISEIHFQWCCLPRAQPSTPRRHFFSNPCFAGCTSTSSQVHTHTHMRLSSTTRAAGAIAFRSASRLHSHPVRILQRYNAPRNELRNALVRQVALRQAALTR